MANAGGGTLLLSGEPDNIRDEKPDEKPGFPYSMEKIFTLMTHLGGAVTPPLHPGLEWKTDDSEELDGVLLTVASSPAPHRVSSGGVPLRLGTRTVFVDAGDLETFRKMRFKRWYEEMPVPEASLDDLDGELIDRLLQRFPDFETAEDLLRRKYGLLTGDGVLKRAALLLFAGDPGAWHPGGGGIEFVRIDDNLGVGEDGEKAPGGSRHGFTRVRKRTRFEGAIPSVIESVFDFLDFELAPRRKSLDLFYEDKISGLPPEVWREAVINAIAHRDYSVEGAPIEILVYDDAVEIRNPGVIPPPVTTEMLLLEPGIHLARNPRICRVLSDMGFMRCLGDGMQGMMFSMIRGFLDPPSIEAGSFYFSLVLAQRPLVSPGAEELLSHLPVGITMSERQKRIVAYCLTRGGGFTTSQYQALNDVGRDTAYREIRELRKMGLVRQTKTGRPHAYFLETGVFYESRDSGGRLRYQAEAPDKQNSETDGAGGEPADDGVDD